MHVCHLCDSSLEGHFFESIADGALRAGIRLTLLQLTSGKAPTWIERYPNARFRSLNANGRLSFLSAARSLARLIREENVDILQTHLFKSGIAGVLSKKFGSRALTILTRHHTSVVRMLGSRLHVAADKWMAENADRVITVSEAARRYMIGVDAIRRDDIEVVHIGLDLERYARRPELRAAIRREFGIADDEFLIGYIANFAPGKGHLELIEAFSKMLEHVPNARIVFAGLLKLDEVTRGAAALPSGKVIFAGWRSDVPSVLNALDLFVQPSLSEAFSLVIIEAMAVGLPVIATDVGGASEVIDDRKTGRIVPPGDVDQLADAMRELALDGEVRKDLGEQGRQSVNERFTAAGMTDRFHELYSQWLRERQ